jgi:hypothetical protein
MIRNSLLTYLCLLPAVIFSQTRYAGYNWNTFPAERKPDTVQSVNGSLILLDREIKEVYLNRENIFEEIRVSHKKIRVETVDAVSRNNKIFVPTDDALEVISIRARFISPAGKVTELPKESIRKVENLENKGDYSSFAIEGAEAGGQIEYFYVLRKKFNAFGTVVKQDNRPRTGVDVILSYPSKLVFLIRSYNGFPRFTERTDSAGITEQRATAGFIAGLEEERYAFYEACLQRYEYTLAYNTYVSPVRTYSWSKIADRFYEMFYDISKKEAGAVRDFLQKINPDLKNRDAAIRAIENRVKSEVSVVPAGEQEMTLDQALKTKQAGKLVLIRLFVALYTEAGIDFDLVVTTDKEKRPFDPDFNGWNYMDEFALCMAGSGRYVVPSEETLRYGDLPTAWQENFGMFFRPVSFREKLKTLSYETRYIPCASTGHVTDSLLVTLQPDPVKLTLAARTHRVFSREIAGNFQAWWHLWDDNRKKEIVKGIFNMGDPNIRIMDYSLLHNTPSDIGLFPMTWEVNAVSGGLMESAGDEILVKIGESIGTQSELYQEKPRMLPVAVETRHRYYRRIEMQIPEGYHTGDIGNLNMDVSMRNNGRISCFFRSAAEIRGNMLVIISEEDYSETFYPKEKFGEFRSVINAASDFNKRTVLLVKNTP